MGARRAVWAPAQISSTVQQQQERTLGDPWGPPVPVREDSVVPGTPSSVLESLLDLSSVQGQE